MPGPRAHRVLVPDEPLLRGCSYADAFEIDVVGSDLGTAEQLARRTLEQSPRLVRAVVRFAQQRLLGLRLAPPATPGHVLGWPIVVSRPDVIQLETRSPVLGRAVILGRRVDDSAVRITTCLFYRRPLLARLAWTVVGPLHRRVAPYLLERAASAAR